MKILAGIIRRYSDYSMLRALVEGTGVKENVKVQTKVQHEKPKKKKRVKTAAMLERELKRVNERFCPAVAGVTVTEMYSLLGRVRGGGAAAAAAAAGVKNVFAGSAYNNEQLRAVMSSVSKNGKMLPSVMLLGRCNSGKSSLVNALVGADVARVKRYAGLTPCVNIYTVAGKFCVVDTPGYGVKGSAWQGELVMETVSTLKEDGSLRKVFIVADATRGAQVSEYDLAVYDMLAGVDVYGDELCTVLNKCDLLKSTSIVSESTTRSGVAGSTTNSAVADPLEAIASAYAVQSGSPVVGVSAALGAVGALLWSVAAAVGGERALEGLSGGHSVRVRVVEARERAKREVAARRADRRLRDKKKLS